MTDDLQKAIHSLQQQLQFHCFLRTALLALTVWNALWGTTILVMRAAFGLAGPAWQWGVSFGVVIALAAFLHQNRHPVSRTEIEAWVDRENRLGGLLVAGSEVPLGAWATSIPFIDPPEVRWRRSRTIGAFAAACCFVLICFSVPQRFAAFSGQHALDLQDQVEQIQTKLQTLAEQELLPPEKAEDLQQKLEQIMKESSGEEPGQTLEALDHIEDMMQKTANKAVEQAINRAENLARARELAKGLMEQFDNLSLDERQRMLEELEKALENASSSFSLGKSGGGALDLPTASDGAQLPGDWSDFVSELGDNQEELEKLLKEMFKAGLTDRKTLEELLKAGKVKKIDLSTLKFGKWDEHATPTEIIFLPVKSDQGGKGGIDRGPGHMEMTPGAPSTREGVKFQEEMLPQARMEALEDAKLIGVGISAPTVETTKVTGGRQTLRDADAAGGSAHSRKVLPRYQPTLKRYFERRIGGP